MKMTGNTIVVTGGGAGIGRGLAQSLHALENEVIVAGRRRDQSKDASATPGMHHLLLDQDDPKSISDFVAELTEQFPGANVLINNAGIQRMEDLKKGEVGDAEREVTTNLLGPIRVTAAMMPLLLKQSHAAIINVSSALGFVPQWITPTYCATKAAIHSYTQSLRWQLRETGVEVIEVIPPWVQTSLQGDRGNNSNAMPLDDFIEEVMAILADLPPSKEVVVDRAKPMRFAERSGDYDAFYRQFSASRTLDDGAGRKGESVPLRQAGGHVDELARIDGEQT